MPNKKDAALALCSYLVRPRMGLLIRRAEVGRADVRVDLRGDEAFVAE